MKTNQLMKVKIGDGVLSIFHLNKFASLQDILQLGNKYRVEKGLPVVKLEDWKRLTSTKEYINIVSEDIGEKAIVTKRGRNGGTYAHIRIIIDLAMYLSAELRDEIIKTFLEKRILDLRDQSGDNYIELNAAIALNAEEVFGKPSHKGHYITIANKIKERLNIDDWNLASPTQLRERARIEEALATMLKAGVVNDWEHLKELVDKV